MADLTFKQLQAATTSLTKEILRCAEGIKQEAKILDDEARDTARTADCIATLKVDKATISETRELGKIITGMREAILEHATACTNTAAHAQAVHAQNQNSHGRLNEVVGRSPVGREIYDVNRQWVTPE